MKQLLFSIFAILILAQSRAQNVGIGTTTPLDPLHVNGFIRNNGIRVEGTNYIELGFGLLNKQVDNGKIAMNAFGEANTLSIVGGGVAADGSDRKIKLWSNGGATILGNVGIWSAPGTSSLSVSSSSGSNLSLQNFLANSAGTQTSIHFGGSNYTSASIRAIGNSSNTARLGFFTGYSFQGGFNNLQENVTISNTGNVGIKNTAPQQALDINGMIHFSGNTPAAFVLNLNTTMMFNNAFMPDTFATCEYVRIDHPYSNNNPNAIITVTPRGKSVPAGVFYRPADGYWYLQSMHYGYIVGGINTSYLQCDSYCAPNRWWPLIELGVFKKNQSSWNVIIMTN